MLPKLLPFAFFLLSTVNSAVARESSGSNSSTFDVEGFASALRSAGFTRLADVASGINQTAAGQQLIAHLAQGNYTLFAPTDEAVSNAPSYITANNETLAQYILYHFVYGDLRNSSYTNTTGGGGGGGGGGATSTASTQLPSSSASSASSSASSSAESSSSSSSASSEASSTSGSASSIASLTTVTATTASTFYNVFSRPVLHRRDGGSGNSSRENAQLQSAIYPNVTLGRTLLDSRVFVQLPCSESQALAWTRPWEDGNVTILNQAQNVSVVNSTQFNNIFINGINGVLIPPGNVSTALTAINATRAENVLSSVSVSSWDGDDTTTVVALQHVRGLTFFVSDNDAFDTAQEQIRSIQNNQTALTRLIANHFTTDEVLYSPNMWEWAASHKTANFETAQPLSFVGNSSGLYVVGSNHTSARIVRPDVLIQNGVIHIVDRVMFNTNYNSQAPTSTSGSQSATTVATTSPVTTVTGVIGGTPTSGATTLSSSSSSEASSTPASTSSSSESSPVSSAASSITGSAESSASSVASSASSTASSASSEVSSVSSAGSSTAPSETGPVSTTTASAASSDISPVSTTTASATRRYRRDWYSPYL